MNTVQGSTKSNCFWMCPRLWSSVFQGRLRSSGRHLYPVKPPFGSTWFGSTLSRCSTDQNLIAVAFTLLHKSSGISFLSLPPLNIHQLTTFKSWEHLCFKSIYSYCTYTYGGAELVRKWNERERSGTWKIRWSGSGAGAGGHVSGSGAVSGGYRKRCERWAGIFTAAASLTCSGPLVGSPAKPSYNWQITAG